MPIRNGFTLIEALITTVLLVTGLAAVAGVFSYSSLSSIRTRQQTVALTLVSTKMEELEAADELPLGRHSEYIGLAADGAVVVAGPGAPYMRVWEVTSEAPARVTVFVYGRRPGRKASYGEVARATTRIGGKF